MLMTTTSGTATNKNNTSPPKAMASASPTPPPTSAKGGVEALNSLLSSITSGAIPIGGGGGNGNHDEKLRHGSDASIQSSSSTGSSTCSSSSTGSSTTPMANPASSALVSSTPPSSSSSSSSLDDHQHHHLHPSSLSPPSSSGAILVPHQHSLDSYVPATPTSTPVTTSLLAVELSAQAMSIEIGPFRHAHELMPLPGDIVEIDRTLFSHWTIYVGGGDVVHFVANDSSAPYDQLPECEVAMVQRSSLIAVAGESCCRVNNKLLRAKERNMLPFHNEIVVRKALSKVGTTVPYNVLHCNAEHYVTEWKYGHRWSDQAQFSLNSFKGLRSQHSNSLSEGHAMFVATLNEVLNSQQAHQTTNASPLATHHHGSLSGQGSPRTPRLMRSMTIDGSPVKTLSSPPSTRIAAAANGGRHSHHQLGCSPPQSDPQGSSPPITGNSHHHHPHHQYQQITPTIQRKCSSNSSLTSVQGPHPQQRPRIHSNGSSNDDGDDDHSSLAAFVGARGSGSDLTAANKGPGQILTTQL